MSTPSTERLQFRDPETADVLADRLSALMESIGRPVTVMHVCGTHEQVIAKYGLRSRLPEGLAVLMGPGCPVCVTTMTEVDRAIAIAETGAIVVTYGDMFRVPGTNGSLADAKAAGADVRVIYSAMDALELAEAEPEREVVFFATGFETTAAPTAAVLKSEPPSNFSVLSAHKYVPPAMEAIAAMPDTEIDGFLAAGHAATITGAAIFEPFVEEFEIPVVVGGFEPLDVLHGLVELLECIAEDEPGVVNAYPRCVSGPGNTTAQDALWEVFVPVAGEWRGIAEIPGACLEIAEEYAEWDATRRFDVELPAADASPLTRQCRCGDIMAGKASPDDCPLFGGACTPFDPVGACMVSSEGTCKIWYEYGGHPDL